MSRTRLPRIPLALLGLAGLALVLVPTGEPGPVPARRTPEPEARPGAEESLPATTPDSPRTPSPVADSPRPPANSPAVAAVYRELEHLTAAWEEGDDERLGKAIDALVDRATQDPESFLEVARRSPRLTQRVFALEILLRAAVQARGRVGAEDAVKIELEVDAILGTLLDTQAQELWELVGEDRGDVRLTTRLERIALRRSNTLEPTALEEALAEVARGEGREGWMAADRLLRHREALETHPPDARIEEALRDYLRRMSRDQSGGRQATALGSLSRIDPIAAVEEASSLLLGPSEGATGPLRGIAARILVESGRKEDRDLVVETLGEPRAEVRLAAARALTDIGHESKRTADALLEILEEQAGFPSWSRRESLDLLARQVGYRLSPPTDVERSGSTWSASKTGAGTLDEASRDSLIDHLSRVLHGDSDPMIRSAAQALLEVVEPTDR